MTAGVVQVQEWAKYPWLRAGFSTRLGGQTTVYGGSEEQNLGWTAEDDAAIVAANRMVLVQAVAGSEFELVTMRQVHSNTVEVVRRGAALSTPEGKAVLQCDGLVTNEKSLLLGVQTADCVPVLVADTKTHAVGAFHAGWRGTLARIVEHGVAKLQMEFGSKPEDLVAAIGPAIRQCCFEVGKEVRSQFESEFAYADALFITDPSGQLRMDLHQANRRQLLDAGLSADAITVIPECTSCERTSDGRRKYFSYRAERGVTGRMMSVIGASVSLAADA
jgi:YfiH family protein